MIYPANGCCFYPEMHRSVFVLEHKKTPLSQGPVHLSSDYNYNMVRPLLSRRNSNKSSYACSS